MATSAVPNSSTQPGVAGASPGGAVRRQQWALSIMVFCSGAVFLGVELGGSRILAPSFGNAVYVWGSLIGQFMAAYAAGAWLGGLLADRRPSNAILSLVVILAGILTCTVIPAIGSSLSDSISTLVANEALGPLVAALALFFVPSLLMAMAPPYAIKLSATSLKGLGRVAGRLSSLYTLGSIVGALATAFILIPLLGVKAIFILIGILLIVSGVLGFVMGPKGATGG